MIKTEIDRKEATPIEDIKIEFEKEFPDFSIRDYSLNDMLMLKKGIQKHEVKIYAEKIFIKSMIDANSSKIAFPIMIFFIAAALLNHFVLKGMGINLLYPIFFSVLLSFMIIPILINLFGKKFKKEYGEMHDRLKQYFEAL